jgi:hypothetical protein
VLALLAAWYVWRHWKHRMPVQDRSRVP